MVFADLQALYFFVVIPLFISILWYGHTRRRRALGTFADSDLVPLLVRPSASGLQTVRHVFLTAALVLSVVALMRPQGGFRSDEVEAVHLDILVAMDTSRSMLAEDVQPNRLTKAKGIVREFAKQLRGERIGLVAFSGSGYQISPLSSDYGAFMQAIDSLDTDTISKGGTSLSAAIDEALAGFRASKERRKILVLVTDGEEHEGDSVKAAERASGSGAEILCVGMGTPEGSVIPWKDDEGRSTLLKDEQGNFVKSPLKEDTLKRIASVSGGAYVSASDAGEGIAAAFTQMREVAPATTAGLALKMRRTEWFQLPLSLAFFLLFAELWLAERGADPANRGNRNGIPALSKDKARNVGEQRGTR